MPGRIEPLATDQIYHVFNKGIGGMNVFDCKKDYLRALACINFYRFASPPFRLSKLLIMSRDDRNSIYKDLSTRGEKLVDIYCYCLMPNHFHFLLKQLRDKGASKFISQFENSYTRFFNTKNERVGSVFLNQFKAKRIESEEVLLHVQRYIHLNPYSSYLVKDLNKLDVYPWSSLSDYLLNKENDLISKDYILSFFKNSQEFREFVHDNADYQRNFERIKHLIYE